MAAYHLKSDRSWQSINFLVSIYKPIIIIVLIKCYKNFLIDSIQICKIITFGFQAEFFTISTELNRIGALSLHVGFVARDSISSALANSTIILLPDISLYVNLVRQLLSTNVSIGTDRAAYSFDVHETTVGTWRDSTHRRHAH